MISRAIAIGGVLALVVAIGTATAGIPDGPRLAFVRFKTKPLKLELLSVNAGGASPLKLAGGVFSRAPVVPFQGPTWSGDGALIAFSGYYDRFSKWSIFIVAADGSALRIVPGTLGAEHPVFSPDGQSIAFARSTRRDSFEGSTTWMIDIATGKSRRLTRWRDGLHSIPSSFSPNGSILALSRISPSGSRAVALQLADGEVTVLARNAAEPIYSPDGSRIAFVSYRDRDLIRDDFGSLIYAGELYVKSAKRRGLRRLTRTYGRQEYSPSWDPSGERLAYVQSTSREETARGHTNALTQINADGTCQRIVFGRKVGTHSAGMDLYAAAWQPGPGREAGRIEC